jgi:replication factor C large subunit
MSELWADKYQPQELEELVGQPQAVKEMLSWAESWRKGKPSKPAILLYGPAGTGKTAAAQALARQMGWDLVEMNASDKRTFDIIKQVAGTASDTETLFSGAGGKRLVVLDEVDNVYGVADRGGYRAIEELIKDPGNPVVLIANDQYAIPWQIRAACLMINFRRVHQEAIIRTLQKICRTEKIEAEPMALKVIAETSNGDLRSAINDLQALAEGKKHLAMKDVVLYKRDREANIFDVLSQLMRATTAKEARELLWSLDMPPEDVLAWIDENMPKMLADPADLAEAYEAIARADIFLGRTKRRQAYGMWRYVSDMMTAGVAMSKSGELKYVRFQMPSVITKMSRTRAARAIRDSAARKIAGHCHTSGRVARRDFLPYLGVIFKRDKKTARRIAAELDFSEGEVDYLVKI